MYRKVSTPITALAEAMSEASMDVEAKSNFVQQVKKELTEDPEFNKKVMDVLKNAKDVEALSKPALFITILSLMASIWADGAKKMFQGGSFNENQADAIMNETIKRGIDNLKKKPQSEKSLRSLIKQYTQAGIISNADAEKYFGVIDAVVTKA